MASSLRPYQRSKCQETRGRKRHRNGCEGHRFFVSNCDIHNHPKVARIEVTQPLELVYTDLSGPISSASGAGNSYVAKVTDHHAPKVGVLSERGYRRLNQLHPRRGDSFWASTSTSSLGPWKRVHGTGISRVVPTDRNQAGLCNNEHTAAKWHARTSVGVSMEHDQMCSGRGRCAEIFLAGGLPHGSLPSKSCPIHPAGR